ncbi:Glycine/sarcosine/betaine reductase component B subunits [Tindallia magadiensis]|uniref:Glycine/sarcosine/betaine reductase component B subunits n=1 Tax=Tindallia magadiensis TaxID=69895 RepID=A0A1I3DA49_9FIRM|nr:glycine/sarcosine/betaine reductase component B subunit [Tindallia magadiensis]SFH83391.1 Glycine/sarcosine/betaine reductase component B subunits [Tindallia magadiensis]
MGMGPSTKETTLHHFQEPMIQLLLKEKDICFTGVIVQGTPEVVSNKKFVADRTADWLHALGVEGAIVSIDSWGNSHIDFTSVLQAVNRKKIPQVGLSFMGNQADPVVEIPRSVTVIDLNKTSEGIESTILGQNTTTFEDARKAIKLLKNKMKKQRRDKQEKNHEEIKNSVNKEIEKAFLQHYYYGIKKIEKAEETRFDQETLWLNCSEFQREERKTTWVEGVRLTIVDPKRKNRKINTILDVMPIAYKEEGALGTGKTKIWEGVKLLLTASDSKGIQPANIGSSEGILSEKMITDRFGTPKETDWLLHLDVTIKAGCAQQREAIYEAHQIAEDLINPLRQLLKEQPLLKASKKEDLSHYYDPARPKVALVKIVSGLGCMYDTAVFPDQPGGCRGAKNMMSLMNMPIWMTPLIYLDGNVHNFS